MWTALVVATLRPTFPSTAHLPGLDRIDPRPMVRALLAESTWTMWLGVVGTAIVYQLLPLLTVYVPLPAVLLPRSLADRHAHRMATHPLYLVRMAMMMVKTVGGLVWGGAPEVRGALQMAPYPADPGSHRDDAMAAVQPGTRGQA